MEQRGSSHCVQKEQQKRRLKGQGTLAKAKVHLSTSSNEALSRLQYNINLAFFVQSCNAILIWHISC